MQQKIEALTKRIDEQSVLAEEYLANLSELKSKLASAEEDIQTWKNQPFILLICGHIPATICCRSWTG